VPLRNYGSEQTVDMGEIAKKYYVLENAINFLSVKVDSYYQVLFPTVFIFDASISGVVDC